MLDDLWKEFQKETQQYKESTEEKKLRFEALKKKDEESARTIARQMKKLQKLQVPRLLKSIRSLTSIMMFTGFNISTETENEC